MNTGKQYAEAGLYYMGGLIGGSVVDGLAIMAMQKISGTNAAALLVGKDYVQLGAEALVLSLGEIALSMMLLGAVLPSLGSGPNQLFMTIGVLQGVKASQLISASISGAILAKV